MNKGGPSFRMLSAEANQSSVAKRFFAPAEALHMLVKDAAKGLLGCTFLQGSVCRSAVLNSATLVMDPE